MSESSASTKRPARAKAEYRNQSLRNGLKVLRALINAPSRGYTVGEVAKAAGVNWDQAFRALITLELEGFARRFIGAWKPGDGLRVLAAKTDLAFTRQDSDVLKLAESMRDF